MVGQCCVVNKYIATNYCRPAVYFLIMGGARGVAGGGAAAPCALLPAPWVPPLVRIMTLGAIEGFSIFFVKSN